MICRLLVCVPLMLGLVVFCTACGDSETSESTARPNILLVVVDSLRADHLSAYGYPRNTSPFLDDFAKRGTRFASAYSHSSHTKLSMASLHTGLTPPAHGLRSAKVKKHRSNKLNDSLHTLAESFRSAGYRTGGLVTNPHLKANQGFSQGYENYRYLAWADTNAETLNQSALDWLNGAEHPFFLYLHYMDVHFPYEPPAPFKTLYAEEQKNLTPLRRNGPGSFDRETIDYSIALYDAQINYWDDRFRDLITTMEQTGQLKNTVVVVVADHGEEFGEHAGFGHGFTTYLEVLHVPLVVVYEGKVPRGAVREELVRLIDIAPTLRGFAGIDVAAPADEGSDLFADSSAQSAERVVYSETDRGSDPRSMRTSKHQMIYNSADDSWEFYFLENDPRNLKNRYHDAGRESEALLAKYKAELTQRMQSRGQGRTAESAEVDDETIKQLKDLGYLE